MLNNATKLRPHFPTCIGLLSFVLLSSNAFSQEHAKAASKQAAKQPDATVEVSGPNAAIRDGELNTPQEPTNGEAQRDAGPPDESDPETRKIAEKRAQVAKREEAKRALADSFRKLTGGLNLGVDMPRPAPPQRAAVAVRRAVATRVERETEVDAAVRDGEAPSDAAAQKPKPDPKKEPNKKSDAPRDEAVRDEVGANVELAAADTLVADIAELANVDPFQQQFSRQFAGLMKAEVFFLNSTCKTNPEQRQKLKAVSDDVLKQVVKKFVELQKKMNQGGFDWNSPAPEPRRAIQDGLADAAKKFLSAEQVALYESQLTKRLEVRKKTCVMNVVAKLDEELILTAEQRVKLTEELTAKWKGAETQQMEIFLYGEHYFPNVPEQFVTPVLNEKQKEVWRGMTRSGNIFFGIGHIGQVAIDENAWAEEEPAVKQPDQAQPAADKVEDVKAVEERAVEERATRKATAAEALAAEKLARAAKEAEKKAAEKKVNP